MWGDSTKYLFLHHRLLQQFDFRTNSSAFRFVYPRSVVVFFMEDWGSRTVCLSVELLVNVAWFPFWCSTLSSLNNSHLSMLQDQLSHQNYIWYKTLLLYCSVLNLSWGRILFKCQRALFLIYYALGFAGVNPLCQTEQEEPAVWYLMLRCRCHFKCARARAVANPLRTPAQVDHLTLHWGPDLLPLSTHHRKSCIKSSGL